MAKFVKLSAEEIAQLSPEEQAKYFADLDAYMAELQDNLEKEKSDRKNAEEMVEELSKQVGKTVSFASGKPVVEHKGKQYRVNAKYVRLRPAPKAPFETYNLDALIGGTAESIKLRDLLIERGSNVLSEVTE